MQQSDEEPSSKDPKTPLIERGLAHFRPTSVVARVYATLEGRSLEEESKDEILEKFWLQRPFRIVVKFLGSFLCSQLSNSCPGTLPGQKPMLHLRALRCYKPTCSHT